MYCKNCGKEVESESGICTGCGFKWDHGDKFCSHCGGAVQPGQAMCLNCGFMIDKADEPNKSKSVDKKDTEKPYMKYKSNVKRMKLYEMIMQVVTICAILAMIFLPIYKCKYEPSLEDLGNIEDREQFLEALETGYLEKEFSLFDDFMLEMDAVFNAGESSSEINGELAGVVNILFSMFLYFSVIFGAVLLFSSAMSLVKAIPLYQNVEELTMLTYNEILKSGEQKRQTNIFKAQTLYAMIAYMVFDIIFAKIFGNMFTDPSMKSEAMADGLVLRNMLGFSGFSVWAILLLVIVAGYIVINVLKKQEYDRMRVEIAKKEYE